MKKEILTMNHLGIGIHEPLLSSITHVVNTGDRIGIIGPNGSGKTTLLRTLAGLEEAMGGSFSVKGKVCYVAQVIQETGNLSGGQQGMKIITEAFAKNPDLILLDEPTNHLDMYAKKSLIEKINSFKGAVLCISHDVWFLGAITNKLWIIHEGQVRAFTGSYKEYQEELKNNEASRERQREVLRKEQRRLAVAKERERARKERSEKIGRSHALDRSTGRGAQGFFKEHAEKAASRIKHQFDKKQELFSDKKSLLSVPLKKKVSGSIIALGKKGALLRMRDATLSVTGKVILKDLSLDLEYGDRVAIIGRNGVGKSALVKSLLGRAWFNLKPEPYISPKIRIEYLDQHYTIIKPSKTVLENVVDFSGEQTERARQHLSHFLFSDAEGVKKKASTLSGGMLARLAFVMLTISPVDLLILDEPTNNLDMDTIDAIIGILSEYKGGLVVISHNGDFLDRIGVSKVLVLKERSEIRSITDNQKLHDIL